jgi:hypothetical protein
MKVAGSIRRLRVERGEPMIQLFDVVSPASRHLAIASVARRKELMLCLVELPDQPLALRQEVRTAIIVRGRSVLPTVVLILRRGLLVGLPTIVAVFIAYLRWVLVIVGLVMHVPEPGRRRFILIELNVGPRRRRHPLHDRYGR